MPIHHTLVKKAGTNNVTLSEAEGFTIARWDENVAIFANHTEPKEALRLCLLFRGAALENPGLVIAQEPDDQDAFVATLNGQVLAEGSEWDDFFVEATDAYAEAGDKPAEGEDDEDAPAGSIVKRKYRDEYKARGNPANCGDWLALQFSTYAKDMVKVEVTIKGKKHMKNKEIPNVENYYAIALANGVTKQWRHLNPGQQAMNVSNMVRAILIKDGKLEIPASVNQGHALTLEPPDNWNEDRLARAAAKKAGA